MPSKLIIVSKHEGQKEIELDKPQITIGRKQENDLQFNRPEISGTHCAFLQEDDQYFVTDLGSTNGTLLNGAKLVAKEKYSLQDGDVVTIAPYRITFVLEKDIFDTMEEAPGDAKDSTGTVMDVAGKIGTGTEEHKQPKATESQPEPAPSPKPAVATPTPPAAPAKPAPAAPKPAAPVEGEELPDSVPAPAPGSSLGLYVWFSIGALFLLVAVGLILFILLA